MQNILFRADSSSTIGTGHIMRDLVLAEQFSDANIIFATQALPGNINHKIEENNYVIKTLNSNNIEELDSLIKELNIDILIIDHYDIDYDFEKQLKIKHLTLKIMSLDDTYEKHYCDILLNHNISADADKYKGLVPNNCELRCGGEFTLLREEFRLEKKRGKKAPDYSKKLSIFIAMGGTDHSNININILDVLKNFQNIHINLVTTTANQNLDELRKYVYNKENITLHINTNKIAKLMNEADLAIVTPSVTINEVYYMELPFIAIKTAENQNEIALYLEGNGFQVLNSYNANNLNNEIKKAMTYINKDRKV